MREIRLVFFVDVLLIASRISLLRLLVVVAAVAVGIEFLLLLLLMLVLSFFSLLLLPSTPAEFLPIPFKAFFTKTFSLHNVNSLYEEKHLIKKINKIE